MVELLAPAGDTESFIAALDGGADAIYVGLQAFSARDGAANFSYEQLKAMTFRAHILGVRVYLAANTLVKDNELAAYLSAVQRAAECGVDAVIIQDLNLADRVKEVGGINVHLSTQAGINNIWGARLAKQMGVSRVILARETAIAEIKEIDAETETEVFIQGALCSSFSGQCLMSSWAGCNSANRGRCKQPCRKRYRLEGEEGYLISLSDLSVGNRIRDLIDAGVSSFKIEGRMRSPAYVYAAVRYYRDLLDGKTPDFAALQRAYNRGNYTFGYAFGTPKDLRAPLAPGHIGAPVGKVTKTDRQGAFVQSSYVPVAGDGFKVLRRGIEVGGGSDVRLVRGGFYLQGRFAVGDEVRLTAHPTTWEPRKLNVSASGRCVAGEELSLTLRTAGGEVTLTGDKVAPARTEPLSQERWRQALGKVGDAPFCLGDTALVTAGFVPMGAINALRRDAYQALAEQLAARTVAARPALIQSNSTESFSQKSVAIDTNFSKIFTTSISFDKVLITADGEGEGDVKVLSPADYRNVAAIRNAAAKKGNRLTLLRIPTFFSRVDERLIEPLLPFFDGIYAEGWGAVGYAMEKGFLWVAGQGLNAFCTASVAGLYRLGAAGVVLSGELSEREVTRIRTQYPGAIVAAEGGVKLMDFLYCPYGGNCESCKGRELGVLTDDEGRTFYLRRVRLSACRFELYNGNALSIPCASPRAIVKLGLPSGGVPTNMGHWRRPLPDQDGSDTDKT